MRPGDGGPAEPSYHFDVRFVAVCPAGAVEQVSDESAALGWFTRDALPEPLADGVAQQIAPALAPWPPKALRYQVSVQSKNTVSTSADAFEISHKPMV